MFEKNTIQALAVTDHCWQIWVRSGEDLISFDLPCQKRPNVDEMSDGHVRLQ
jgi:hypothetical protein